MSKYPVGATWVAETSRGKATIWLESRSASNFEVWYWSFQYPDGTYASGWEGYDWGHSYRQCRDQCYWKVQEGNDTPVKFRRA